MPYHKYPSGALIVYKYDAETFSVFTRQAIFAKPLSPYSEHDALFRGVNIHPFNLDSHLAFPSLNHYDKSHQ